MLKIENVKISRFPVALHLQFATEVKELIEKHDHSSLRIGDLYAIFSACIEKEDLCYKVVRKSTLSSRKGEIDYARDTAITGIKHVIKAGLRHFDKNICEAAQRLKIVFDTYNKPIPVTNLSYDAETAAINNLIQELGNKYASDIQTAGIEPWIVELQTQNDAFDSLVKNYNVQQSETPPFLLTDARKEIDRAYHDIVTFINALIVVEKTSNYDPFVVELNTLIKHYNNLHAQHLGRMQASKEKKEEGK